MSVAISLPLVLDYENPRHRDPSSFQKLQWFYPIAANSLNRELDFSLEAANAERTSVNFQHYPNLAVPRVLHELSAKRVLTMEFIDAPRIDDVSALDAAQISRLEVARILLRVFAEMMFINGFVHCDPHPGNLLVRWSPEVSCPCQHASFLKNLYFTVLAGWHLRAPYSCIWCHLAEVKTVLHLEKWLVQKGAPALEDGQKKEKADFQRVGGGSIRPFG